MGTTPFLDSIPLEDVFQFVPAFEGSSRTPFAYAMFYAFNTEVTLQFYPEEGNDAAAEAAARQALSVCRRFEHLFSRTLKGSDVTHLNQAKGSWVPIAEETYDLLQKSIAYCADSEGVFDITMGSVTRLWDFQFERIPRSEELKEALSHVDYRTIELAGDTGARQARLKDPEAFIDVGGVAKGYIADALCDLLVSLQQRHFVINLGGNVVVWGGKPDGSPFKVGIKNPRDTQAILGSVALTHGSVVTSGLYERAFTWQGRTYSHILSPQTGYPIETDVEGVTVVAEKSVDCDGYSTTLCALGLEKGKQFAARHPQLQSVIFVDSNNRLVVA